jgi:hypothetical protein
LLTQRVLEHLPLDLANELASQAMIRTTSGYKGSARNLRLLSNPLLPIIHLAIENQHLRATNTENINTLVEEWGKTKQAMDVLQREHDEVTIKEVFFEHLSNDLSARLERMSTKFEQEVTESTMTNISTTTQQRELLGIMNQLLSLYKYEAATTRAFMAFLTLLLFRFGQSEAVVKLGEIFDERHRPMIEEKIAQIERDVAEYRRRFSREERDSTSK